MKTINISTGYQNSVERYDLNEVDVSHASLCPGGVIFYALATNPEVKFISFYGKELHDRDDPYFETLHYNENKPLPDVDEFMSLMRLYNISDFKCRILYKNTVISISGNASSTEIGLSYPLKTPVNVLPLLSAVEAAGCS